MKDWRSRLSRGSDDIRKPIMKCGGVQMWIDSLVKICFENDDRNSENAAFLINSQCMN